MFESLFNKLLQIIFYLAAIGVWTLLSFNWITHNHGN